MKYEGQSKLFLFSLVALIKIPNFDAENNAEVSKVAISRNGQEPESLTMKILICEDNPMAMKTLSVILEREGYEADTAEDGNRALELLKNNDYDLLVVDIHLPYRSGLELVKYVRSDQGKDTPALMLTAFSDPQIQRQAGELGISGYITKPFNPSDLVNRIKSILGR